MSGHLSERFNPRGNEELGDSNAPRAQESDDDRFLTPPLSLINGEAGQTPDAMEERAENFDLEDNPPDSRRAEES